MLMPSLFIAVDSIRRQSTFVFDSLKVSRPNYTFNDRLLFNDVHEKINSCSSSGRQMIKTFSALGKREIKKKM